MEFQAIVFCGLGHNLEPISGKIRPKPLLSVANKPVIDYVLEWCDRAQFKEVILAVANPAFSQVQEHVKQRQRTRVVGVSGSTAEALALLAPSLTGDFVILPCDFITDIDPEVVISKHRSRKNKVLISGFFYKNAFESVNTKKQLNPDILLHSADGAFLDLYSMQQVKDAKQLRVRASMLYKYPNVIASTEVLSACIYVCPHEVLHLITDTDEETLGVNADSKSISKLIRDFGRRSWQHAKPLESVGFNMLPDSFFRVNNLAAYLEANRHFLKQKARSSGKQVKPTDKLAAIVGNDAIVDASAELGERTNVKRTVIGPGCVIGKKCRLNGCVILEDVVINDDVALENCVVGVGATIQAGAKLTSCNVEGGYTVRHGYEARDENLEGVHLDMPQLREVDESDSDSGESYTEEEYEEDFEEDDGLFDRS